MYANKALQEGAERFARRALGGAAMYASSNTPSVAYGKVASTYSTYD
jgi:hypothetical protein